MSELLLLLVGLLAGALLTLLALLPRLRAGRMELRLLESELTSSRHERQELETELASAREHGGGADLAAENAELRRRMDEVADLIMREGAASSASAPSKAAAED